MSDQHPKKLCVDRCKKCGATDKRDESEEVSLFVSRRQVECRECHTVGDEKEIAAYDKLCAVCEEVLPKFGDEETEPILSLSVNANMTPGYAVFGYSHVTVHARCVSGLGVVLTERQADVLEEQQRRGGLVGPFADWCKNRLLQLRGPSSRSAE